jgi:hypothetical protein
MDKKPVNFLKDNEIKIDKEDIFLEEEEKQEIWEMIQNNFAEMSVETLSKLLKDNYNQDFSKNTDKDSILETLYHLERQEKIRVNFDKKQSLISHSLLEFDKYEKNFLEEKKTSLEKMEYWAVELQYRNYFTESSEEELSKQEMIDKILEMENKNLVRTKICKIMNIPC